MGWKEIRESILKRDNYTCQGCGSKKDLQVHHIVSQYVGGTDDPKNLITLCNPCHSKITWRGFWIRKWTNNWDRTKGEGLELLNDNWKTGLEVVRIRGIQIPTDAQRTWL